MATDPASKAPLPRWLWIAGGIAVAVFVVDALYLYGTKFNASIHSDAAVTALLGQKILTSGSLFARDWYYANGDVWVLGPHWFAVAPIALWGLGAKALLVAVVTGFLAEIAALTWAYERLARDLRVALLATAVTLLAWSRLHVLFVYIELSYGFISSLYIALFTAHALWLSSLASGARRSRALPIVACLGLFVTALQNPPRALLFAVGPVLLACAWPYRSVPWKARARVAVSALACCGAAYGYYQLVLRQTLAFSIPAGHIAFELKDLTGVLENLRTLGQGIAALAGAPGDLSVLALPGILMIAGATALVFAEIFRERVLTPLRFVCLGAATQFGLVLGPMVLGNLIVNPPSVRYLMPSFLLFFGLGIILSVRELGASLTRRRLAMGWLVLVPIVAVIALQRILGSYSLEAKSGQWAHRDAHATLAAELERRHLTHGFGAYWNSNLVTLLSHGAAKTCSVSFADRLIPYKWVTDTECFEEALIPERIYVVQDQDGRAKTEASVRATLGEPIEHFDVDGVFEVEVFRAHDRPLDWLATPLPEGEDLRFPLRLSAGHPQLVRAKATAETKVIAATGEEGTVSFGPYVTLPRGRFHVRWIGSGHPSSGAIAFDIAARGGKTTLVDRAVDAAALSAIHHGELVTLDFELKETTPAMEFRVYSRGGALVTLEALEIERVSDRGRP